MLNTGWPLFRVEIAGVGEPDEWTARAAAPPSRAGIRREMCNRRNESDQ